MSNSPAEDLGMAMAKKVREVVESFPATDAVKGTVVGIVITSLTDYQVELEDRDA